MSQFERIEPTERWPTFEKPLEPSKPNPFKIPPPPIKLVDILEAETKEHHAKNTRKKSPGRPKKVHPKSDAAAMA